MSPLDLLNALLDLFRPPCPSGLPHRKRGPTVRDFVGRRWCWHPACKRAAVAAVLHDCQEEHACARSASITTPARTDLRLPG